jgi:fucose permease
VSLTVAGVLLIALGQVRSVGGILPVLFAFALFAGMLYPANATSMSKICPTELQVKGFALNRLANNLGATIGPAIGGVLALRDYRLLLGRRPDVTGMAAFRPHMARHRAAADPRSESGSWPGRIGERARRGPGRGPDWGAGRLMRRRALVSRP